MAQRSGHPGRVGGENASSAKGSGGGPAGGKSGGDGGKKERGLLESIGDLFGGATALANNPSWAGNQTQTGMLASFPEASPGYIAGTMFDAMNFGPISALSTIGNAAYAATQGTTPEGIGQRIAKEFGATRGPQGPDVPGGGRERSGQGGALRDATLWNDVPTEAQQVTQPDQKAQDALTEFKKRQYALGLNGVPAPLGYQYGTAKWL